MDDGTPLDVVESLVQFGVIPVLRLPERRLALRAVDALAAAGFRTVEVTLTVPDAFGVIADIARRGDLLVGAGTVLSPARARDAIEAGASYVVTPCLVDDVPELCRRHGVASIAGAMTPSEVLTASERAQAVKVFPAASVGGPAHLKALRSIFPEAVLIPTGGVNLANMTDYLDAGARAVGVGSELFDVSDLEAGHLDEVAKTAGAYLERLRDHRGGRVGESGRGPEARRASDTRKE